MSYTQETGGGSYFFQGNYFYSGFADRENRNVARRGFTNDKPTGRS
jgi:hypothetical protein